MRIVIAGGGPAGLSTALALARAGHNVTIVERDALPESRNWSAAFEWPRKGIPHFYQPHALLARGYRILREYFPDVLERLIAAGAEQYELWRKIPGPHLAEDEELIYLGVRRPLIEWALRDAVVKEPKMVLRSGQKVIRFLGTCGAVPRVTGVALDDGSEIAADLVVDAMGRRSPASDWLAGMGAPVIATESLSCGVVYYSRHFKIAAGQRFPNDPWLFAPVADVGYALFTTFIGDNNTFAVVAGIPTWDHELRVLQNDDAFLAACRSVPVLAPLLADDFAEPITPVLPMGGLENTIRDYSPGGTAVARGFVPVGDAVCHTNPANGLGLSFALVHALELRDALASSELESQYLAQIAPEVREQFKRVCDIDSATARRRRGEQLDMMHRTGCYPLFTGAVMMVARMDAEICRKVLRRFCFLDLPSAIDDDLPLQERMEALLQKAMASAPPRKQAKSRDELIGMLGGGRSAAAPST